MPPKLSRQQKQEEERRKLEEEARRIKALAEEREKSLKLIEEESRDNALRLAIIEDSLGTFDNLRQDVQNQKELEKEKEDWEKYLKCDKIPDTRIPAEARCFLYRFDGEFIDYHYKQINWWLKCDQNSIMTQDLNIPDTRRFTIDQTRVPTGRFYDQKMRFMMKVYESLEDTLRRQKVSESRLNDLITIKSTFREQAFHFLDVLTFEILMSIDREMRPLTPITAYYSYSSPDFIKFLWSFKDVTLPPNREKYRIINIPPLQMNVTMSNVLNLETTAVRILWFKRDFFSDFCPSFKPSSFEMKFENFNEVMEKEMKMRQYFKDKRLAEMRESREEYEILMENLRLEQEAEEAEKKSKKSNTSLVSTKSNKSGKFKSLPEEPPIVDECTYVDVEKDYLEYENEKLREEKERLSPDSLNLSCNDLNMRQCEIIGGIYKVECIEIPNQDKEIYQHMFVRLNERPHVLKYTQFYNTYENPVLKNVKEERKSVFTGKVREAKINALAGLIKVEMKLNDKIIWWEQPIACRWEPWEESDEFKSLDPALQDYNINFEKYQEIDRKKLWKSPEIKLRDKIELTDFQLSSYPEEIKFSELVRIYLHPVMPEEFPCYADRLEIFGKKQEEWRFIKAIQDTRKDVTSMAEKLDKFLELFEMKHFRPRKLFPVKLKNKIELLENEEMKTAIKKARFKIQKMISQKEDYIPEFISEIPIKDEPLLLSELLRRLNNLHKNLLPVFRDIKRYLQPQDNKEEENPKIPRKSGRSRMTNIRIASISEQEKSKITKKIKHAIKESLVQDSVTMTSEMETTTDSKLSETKPCLIPHYKGKWVLKDIYEESYDEETKIFTFYTGRSGTFGLAVKKYLNLPFKNWEFYPIHQRKSVEKYVLMTIEGQNISIEFKITDKGITFKILKPGKTPMQELKKPVKIFELKRILKTLNINLFPEVDAEWYVYGICEKHTSMEFHTYKSMASYCLSHQFQRHRLNRFGTRREILMKSKMYEFKNFSDLLITPLKVLTVDVIDNEGLQYEANPPEQEFCPDLVSYLKTKVDKAEYRMNQKYFMIIWHVQALLMNLRPLSFSL